MLIPVRPLLALAVVVVILGGTGLYMRFQEAVRPVAQPVRQQAAQGEFAVDITLTFEAAPSPFSLEPVSLMVTLAGQTLLRREAPVPAGAPILIEPVPGLVEAIPGVTEGRNEFFIRASVAPPRLSTPDGPASAAGEDAFALEAPSEADPVLLPSRAVRVRVLRDGIPIAEETLWSEPGADVAGTVTVTIPPSPTAATDAE